MTYISKRTLHFKGRFISPGGKVPEDYPRLSEGLRHGWIVQIASPAAASPKPVQPVKPEIITKPVIEEKVTEPPKATEEVGCIAALPWLTPMAKDSLDAIGIKVIADLAPYSMLDLIKLKGIGEATAEKLVLAFKEYCDSVEGPIVDTAPEPAKVEYELGEED